MTHHASIDFAQIKEGDALPNLTFEVSYTTLAQDVAGTRDYYPIHHDPEFAKAGNARNIFLNTMWYQGMVNRFVSEWAGYESFLRKLSVDMKSHGCPGDTITVRGTVLATRTDDQGCKLVDLDVRMDNQLQPDVLLSKVTVEIP